MEWGDIMEYKFVTVNPIQDSTTSFTIENILNEHQNEGWEFYSFAPQIEIDGTYSNKIIFMKE